MVDVSIFFFLPSASLFDGLSNLQTHVCVCLSLLNWHRNVQRARREVSSLNEAKWTVTAASEGCLYGE